MFDKRYTSRVEELKPWLARESNRDRLYDSEIIRTEEILSMGDAPPADVIRDTMHVLSHSPVWLSKYGISLVLDGKLSGWVKIVEALRYKVWKSRIQLYAHLNPPDGWRLGESKILNVSVSTRRVARPAECINRPLGRVHEARV